jgi:hypothetical protein
LVPVMTPSSQGLEQSPIPGRFKYRSCVIIRNSGFSKLFPQCRTCGSLYSIGDGRLSQATERHESG